MSTEPKYSLHADHLDSEKTANLGRFHTPEQAHTRVKQHEEEHGWNNHSYHLVDHSNNSSYHHNGKGWEGMRKCDGADMATKKIEKSSKVTPEHIEETIRGIKGSYGDKYSDADHTHFRERAKKATSHKHLAQMVENHYDLDPADARDMATPSRKHEKHWHIEIIEKAERAIGTLKNGKQFFLSSHHPAHKSFTGQEHAEAAAQLRDKGQHIMQTGMDQDDGFGIQHGRNLMISAKAHGERAKEKGLPPTNRPPKS